MMEKWSGWEWGIGKNIITIILSQPKKFIKSPGHPYNHTDPDLSGEIPLPSGTSVLLSRVFLFFLFTFAFCLEANATIRYVSKTGNSTPPYLTWETASDSIQKCINVCEPFDTIYVSNGEYKETLLIDRAINLFGLSMDSCIINGTDLNSFVTGYEGITIFVDDNFTMENFHVIGKGILPLTTAVFAPNGFGFINNIRNCKIENSYGGVSGSFCFFTWENLFLSNCSTDLSNWNPYDEYKNIVNNCVIVKTIGDCAFDNEEGHTIITNNLLINLSQQYHPQGLFMIFWNKSRIIKNNIILNFRHGIWLNGESLRDSAIIENNTIGYSTYRGILAWGQNIKLRNNILFNNLEGYVTEHIPSNYNLYWNNTTNIIPSYLLGEHDIIADPMFVKDDSLPAFPPNFDLHLQKYSPAIDEGDPDILDKDGSRSDMGAYGGPGGEQYRYLDLPPTPPKNFNIITIPDSNRVEIKWDYNTEADFSHYSIYKDTVPVFTPDSSSFYALTDTSFFIDYYNAQQNKAYYKITSTDSQNNESIPGETISIITGLGEPRVEIIREYKLYQNYPNPFNPETKIPFTIKERAYVKLMIYNLLGERIAVLVNSELEAGIHEIVYKPKSNLPSGIYLCRIEVIGEGNIPKYSDLRKIVYLK